MRKVNPVCLVRARRVIATSVVLVSAQQVLVSGQQALAQSWLSTGSSTWNNPANWNPATVPNASGVAVTFPSTITTNNATATLDISATLGSILFTPPVATNGFTVAGTTTASGATTLTFAGSSTPSVVVLGTAGTTSNATLALSVPLAGTGGLIKASNSLTGSYGRLTLNADNSNLTGGILIQAGYLRANTAKALGSNDITVSASGTASSTANWQSLEFVAGLNISNRVIINGATGPFAGVINMANTGATQTGTYSGTVTLTGSGGGSTFSQGGTNAGGSASGGGLLIVTGPVNADAGLSAGVRAGNVRFANTGNLGTARIWTLAQGYISFGASNQFPSNSDVTVGASGAAIWDLNGYSQTVRSVIKGANGATVTNTGSTTSRLTIDGTVANGAGFTGVVAGNLAITVKDSSGANTGVFTLSSSSNSFSGGIRLEGGTVNILSLSNGGTNGNLGSASSSSTNIVFQGGTLSYVGGTGSASDRQFSVVNGSTATININPFNVNLTVPGFPDAGTGVLIKTGPGNLNLSGTQGFTGGIIHRLGVLRAQVANAFGSNDITIAATGTPSAVGGASTNVAGGNWQQIDAQPGLTVNNNIVIVNAAGPFEGILTSKTSNANLPTSTVTYAGTITVQSNTFGGGVFGGPGTGSFSGEGLTAITGTVNATPGVSVAIRNGNVLLSASGNVMNWNVVSGYTRLGAALNTGAALNVGAVSNTATFDVSGLALTLSSLNGPAETTTVTNSGGSLVTLTLDGTTTSSYAGSVAGNLALVIKNSAGTGAVGLALPSVSSTFSGGIQLLSGSLSFGPVNVGGTNSSLGASSPVASNLVLGAGTTLSYSGTGVSSTDRQFTLPSSGNVTLGASSASGTVTFAGASVPSSASVTKVGPGVFALSGSQAYTGNTIINEGVLQLTGDGTLASTAVTVASGASLGFARGTDYSYSGNISGAGGVSVSSGAVTLAGSLAYTGPTRVTGGSLTSTSPLRPVTGALLVTGTGSANLAASPTTLAGTGYTVAGEFSTVSVTGGGVASIPAVNRGANKAAVLVTRSLDLSSGGTLDLGNNDLIIKGGAASIAQVRDYFTSNALTASAILPASAFYTPFTTLALFVNDAGNGQAYFDTYDGVSGLGAGDLIVKYTYVGDTNLDGVLDGQDYKRAFEGFINGQSGWAWGDVNNSGDTVTAGDFAAFVDAYAWYTGQSSPTSFGKGQDDAGAVSSIPEPGALGLAAIPLGILGRRRRAR